MMKRILLVLTVCLLTTLIHATNVFSYTLEKHQKLLKTMSIEIEDSMSLHLVFVKNKKTKMYDILPFLINESKQVSKLTDIHLEKEPDILSYHFNNGTVTLTNYRKEVLDIIDINLWEGFNKKESLRISKKPSLVFTEKNSTYLLTNNDMERTVSLISITNRKNISDKSIEFSKEQYRKIFYKFSYEAEVVKTNEYVKNGSIASTQAYFSDGSVVFVMCNSKNKKEKNIELFSLNPNTDDNTLTYKTIPFNSEKKYPKINSHLLDNHLFYTILSKENAFISVYDIKQDKTVKQLSIDDLAVISNISSLKSSFLKEANKTKKAITITANKTINGNYKVTLDYVDKTTYNYDFFWFHQWNMQMMQQNMMRSAVPSGFGPNPENYFYLPLKNSKKNTSFSFVLDQDFNLKNSASSKTVYPEIDKKEFLKKLSENKNFENISASFIEEECRYIYFDKVKKKIFIKFKPTEQKQVN